MTETPAPPSAEPVAPPVAAGPRARLYLGDCLELLQRLPDASVQLVTADPPYGVTACPWDTVIPLEPLWSQLRRVLTPAGAVVLTSAQPFTTTLIASNRDWFKYCWVWVKTRATNFVNAKNRPMSRHEDVVVFSPGTTANRSPRRMDYFPQGLQPCGKVVSGIKACPADAGGHRLARPSHQAERVQEFTNYPTTVLEFASEAKTIHPTQKPVALFEYLVRTYSRPDDLVLDFACGSGTTGVACLRAGRRFVGMECDRRYWVAAKHRLTNARAGRPDVPNAAATEVEVALAALVAEDAAPLTPTC